jgi:hypothetical protein
MTGRNQQRRILEKHYESVLEGRRMTEEEIDAEIANLNRKKEKGTLDDFDEHLAAQLQLI